MALVKKVSYEGNSSIATLSGDIRIEQAKGRMVIYDPDTNRELNVVDRSGYLFSDGADRRVKIGSSRSNVGIWVSKPGEDVIELLGNG